MRSKFDLSRVFVPKRTTRSHESDEGPFEKSQFGARLSFNVSTRDNRDQISRVILDSKMNPKLYTTDEFNSRSEIFSASRSLVIPEYTVTVAKGCYRNISNSPCFVYEQSGCLRNLEANAFQDSGFITFTVPATVQVIEKQCFLKAKRLTAVWFENNSHLREIGIEAFKYCAIKQIEIPKSVVTIGVRAFEGCSRLKKVFFENDSALRTIEDSAFQGCDEIDSIWIPDNCRTIQSHAFTKCGLETVKLPANLEVLGDSVFAETRITSCNIGEKVTKIGSDCFYKCERLVEAKFSPGIQLETLPCSCFKRSGIVKIVIPRSVKIIQDMCFSHCNWLREVEFENDSMLTEIQNAAFIETALYTIELPDSVETIGDMCFMGCSGLRRFIVTKNSNLSKIGEKAFIGCDFDEFVLPLRLEIIEKYPIFTNCKINIMNILDDHRPDRFVFEDGYLYRKSERDGLPDTLVAFFDRKNAISTVEVKPHVEVIEAFCFADCLNVTCVILNEETRLRHMKPYTFTRSGLQSLTIPASIEVLDVGCFADCRNLVAISFDRDCKISTLSDRLFYCCDLISIKIPSNVREIGNECFFANTRLKSIIINEGCTRIGRCAFVGTGISEIRIPSSVITIGESCFQGCSNLVNVEFDENSKVAVFASSLFQESRIREICIPRSVESIKESCFMKCSHLSRVYGQFSKRADYGVCCIPGSIKAIGGNVFHGCDEINTICFETSDNVTLASCAFVGLRSLNDVVLPAGQLELPDYLLQTSSLITISFNGPTVLAKFGASCFTLSSIHSIEIPATVQVIESDCFRGCASMHEVLFAPRRDTDVTLRIGSYAFSQTLIERIVIPKCVVEIENGAFRQCKHLRAVVFEKDSPVKILPEYAFSNCALEMFDIPKSVEEIKAFCFVQNSPMRIRFEAGSELKQLNCLAFSETCLRNDIVVPKTARITDLSKSQCCTGQFENLTILRKKDNNGIPRSDILWLSTGESIVKNTMKEIKDDFTGLTELENITFQSGSTLETIEIGVFDGCSSLRSVTFPKSLKKIGSFCFRNCKSLLSVDFEPGTRITAIGGMGISWTNPKDIVIPKNIREIPDGCFCGFVSLAKVRFEDGSQLNRVGSSAFAHSGLLAFKCPKTVITIANDAFSSCKSLSDFVFEDGSEIEILGENAFNCSAIKRITLPRPIRRIGDCCFQDTDCMTRVILPRGSKFPKSVGKNVFNGSKANKFVSQGTVKMSVLKQFYQLLDKDMPECAPCETLGPLPSLPDTPEINMSEYEVRREVGTGSFGRVMLYENRHGQRYAVKKMDLHEDNYRFFVREFEALKAIQHPCVVTVHGWAILPEEGKLAIATEYEENGTLADAMRKKTLNNTQKAIITFGIAAGMHAIHSKGMIHCDVKPSNILLDSEFHPRICDFGSSWIRSRDLDLEMISRSCTPLYTAPELIDDDEFDNKIDVYSFGLVIYELITGRSLAFRGLGSLLSGRVRLVTNTHHFADPLIDSCCQLNPERRPSFDEIYEQLRQKPILPDVDMDVYEKYVETIVNQT